MPGRLFPPTEAGSSLGCSGCRPAAAQRCHQRVSPVSPPVFRPRPAGHQEPDDVWGCSGSCGGATSISKHVVAATTAVLLPPPGASHDPAQAKQPHARGCSLILANWAVEIQNPGQSKIQNPGQAAAPRQRVLTLSEHCSLLSNPCKLPSLEILDGRWWHRARFYYQSPDCLGPDGGKKMLRLEPNLFETILRSARDVGRHPSMPIPAPKSILNLRD